MKESMFNVAHVVAILLSAMVGTIQSVGLNLTILSPQIASADQDLPFSEPMTIHGESNLMSIQFRVLGFLVTPFGGAFDVAYHQESISSGEYGDVAESDYPVIDQHLAAYGVSGFVTTYAFFVKWTYPGNPTLQSRTLLATNGAQTYYSAWHPGATTDNTAGLAFSLTNFDYFIGYRPNSDTIYVFQADLYNFVQLTALPTTTPDTTTTTTTTPETTTITTITPTTMTSTSVVQLPSRNSATKIASSADTGMLLLTALLCTTAVLFYL